MFREALVPCRYGVLWGFLAVGTLAALPTVGKADTWTPVYAADFSTDPAWTTNNSDRYYWRPADQTYQVTMYDNSEEYSTVAVPYAGQSFKLTFDVFIESINWAGDIDFGLYDASRDAGYYTGSGAQFARINFSVGDLGKGLQLRAGDKDGTDHVMSDAYPSWAFNTWYSGMLVYDASAATISWEMRNRDTGLLVDSLSVSGVSGFTTLQNLGASKVSDFYYPPAFGSGQIDNVTLYVLERDPGPVPTVSEWGMMAMAGLMLSAGGVLIARRRAGRGITSYE